MILTDLDNIKFAIEPDMIREINERKTHREIVTVMGDHLLVRESMKRIQWLIMEERNAGPHSECNFQSAAVNNR